MRWVITALLALAILIGAVLFFRGRAAPRDDILCQKGDIELQSGNVAAAIEQFRRALEVNPEHFDAQYGLVRALTAHKDFQEALTELRKLREMGLTAVQDAMHGARIYSARAGHRLASAGNEVSLAICDGVVAQELDPAIELLAKQADPAEGPAAAYTLLGDLYRQKAGVLGVKVRLLLEATNLAASLQRTEEAAQKVIQRTELMPQMYEVLRRAVAAYGRAMELEPELAAPRLAIASIELSGYIPRPDRARDLLEPVVSREPHHLEARRLLAAAERMAGDYDKALEHIRAVRATREANFELMLTEARILLDAGRWEEAAPLSRELIATRPSHPWVAYLRGRVLLHEATSDEVEPSERPGKAREAANHLQRIFRGTEPPSFPEARFALAEALRESGNRGQAISAYMKVFDDLRGGVAGSVSMMRERFELSYRSRLVLAQELSEEDPAAAADHAARALLIFPGRPEAMSAARQAYERAGRQRALPALVVAHAGAYAGVGGFERALQICRDELPRLADTSEVRRFMALVLVRSGAYQEAAKTYHELWLEFPEKRAYAYELVDLHSRLGHEEEARKVCEELLAADPEDPEALTRMIMLLAHSGDVEGARSLLVSAERALGADAVVKLLMYFFVREGQVDEAIALTRAQVAVEPDNGRPRAVLGDLLWAAGDLSEARVAFNEGLRLAPDFPIAYRRGFLDLYEGKTIEAVALFRLARKRFGDHPPTLVSLAIALQANDQAQEAVQLLEWLLAQPWAPSLGVARWYLAVIHAGLGESDSAVAQNAQIRGLEHGLHDDRRALLERLAASDYPRRSNAAAALNVLVLFARNSCPQAALEQAEVVAQLLPDEPLAACWGIRILDDQGEHEKALEKWEQVVRERPDFLYGRIVLALGHARHGDSELAVGVLEEALPHASEGQAAAVHVKLGDLFQQQGRFDMAISHYEAAMSDRAIAPLACNNVAYILAARRNDPAAALPLAERALQLGGPHPGILDTLGWIHHLLGDSAKATALLGRAKRALPANPVIRFHLGMAYLKAGRQAEARAELEEALSISRTFPEAEEAATALRTLR